MRRKILAQATPHAQEHLMLSALRNAVDEGDAAYARGEFKIYSYAGELVAELKAKLLNAQVNSASGSSTDRS
jgi:hypothetical protein